MSTITRERLLKIQQWRETYGPGSNVVLPAEEAEELARIALASPSVDEDLLHMAASAIDDLLSNKVRSGAGVWSDIPSKLRRAAMLQGGKS